MSDTTAFLIWLLTIESMALAALPLATKIFKNFADRGFAFAKILGILLTSYITWLLGSLKLAPFTRPTIFCVVLGITAACWIPKLLATHKKGETKKLFNKLIAQLFNPPKLILIEEFLFILALAFWSIVRAYNPDIHGLEKYMDYGFVLSILRGKYFPPLDHFLANETINYYYFGHLICALLTKLSTIPPQITYNLQIAHLFALTVLESFSIGVTLASTGVATPELAGSSGQTFTSRQRRNLKVAAPKINKAAIATGILSFLFTAIIGNLHAVSELLKGNFDKYWYPTATRLIPYTIDEFPVYSWIVADLHGHVSDIPTVLLAIALLFSLTLQFKTKQQGNKTPEQKNRTTKQLIISLFGFSTAQFFTLAPLALAIGAMYATNAWNFPIYLGLTGTLFFFLNWQKHKDFNRAISEVVKLFLFLIPCTLLLYLPYWLTVKPLTKGMGIVHTRSPLNLILILWGFYGFLGITFILWLFRKKIREKIKTESLVKIFANLLGVKIKLPKQTRTESEIRHLEFGISDSFSCLLILFGFLLILLPEIIYMKDIYTPDYYRANTMFKFYFQAWIMLALGTSYGVIRVIRGIKKNPSFFGRLLITCYLLLITSVLLYPYISINTITNRFTKYQGLSGTTYLQKLYPDDAAAISWLNENITNQPTILEAVGESYTDYARVSANTGLPAVLGWPVHEWLWRGSYDEAGKRTAEVEQIYEGENITQIKPLLKQYNVKYIFIGQLEREKYKNLKEEKFKELGNIVFESGKTKIYRLEPLE